MPASTVLAVNLLAGDSRRRRLTVTLAGYALGSHVPNIDHYLPPIVAVVVLVFLVPIGVEILRNRRRAVTR